MSNTTLTTADINLLAQKAHEELRSESQYYASELCQMNPHYVAEICEWTDDQIRDILRQRRRSKISRILEVLKTPLYFRDTGGQVSMGDYFDCLPYSIKFKSFKDGLRRDSLPDMLLDAFLSAINNGELTADPSSNAPFQI